MRNIKNGIMSTVAICFIFVASMIMFGINGSAYIDPSVTTYVIQAVAGIVVAVGAVAGIYLRKAKKKVQDKLGLEETKERESDDIIVKDESIE